jgi:hypothetical protein
MTEELQRQSRRMAPDDQMAFLVSPAARWMTGTDGGEAINAAIAAAA